MNLSYRLAIAQDIPACVELRGKTRENAVPVERLKALGITVESWTRDVVDGTLAGYICLVEDVVVGYCFGDTGTGEVCVLALYPEWEGKGIGKQLLDMMTAHLADLGFARLFLGCSANPQVRSHGFYRHLGWKPTGAVDSNRDQILEYFPAQQVHRTLKY